MATASDVVHLILVLVCTRSIRAEETNLYTGFVELCTRQGLGDARLSGFLEGGQGSAP